jgi:hypothetical protein
MYQWWGNRLDQQGLIPSIERTFISLIWAQVTHNRPIQYKSRALFPKVKKSELEADNLPRFRLPGSISSHTHTHHSSMSSCRVAYTSTGTSLSFNEHDISYLDYILAKVCIISLALLLTYVRTLTQDESFVPHVDPLKTKGNKSTFMSSGPRILKALPFKVPQDSSTSISEKKTCRRRCVCRLMVEIIQTGETELLWEKFGLVPFSLQKIPLWNNDGKNRTQTSKVRSWRVSVPAMARSFKN